MKKRHMPEMREGGVNVTPLIDVVMVLVIFFMLVAKIGVSAGVDPSIQIPVTTLGKELKSISNTLTLNVSQPPGATQPMVTALVQGGTAPQELKVLDERTGKKPLLAVLQELRKNNPEFSIIIRGDQDMEYRFLEPVLITCAEANVKNVNFNTRKPTGEVKRAEG